MEVKITITCPTCLYQEVRKIQLTHRVVDNFSCSRCHTNFSQRIPYHVNRIDTEYTKGKFTPFKRIF
jgi:transposase-like protein